MKEFDYAPFIASMEYYNFDNKDINFDFQIAVQQISQPTLLTNNEGITLMYFLSDGGQIEINQIPYDIEKNTLLCISSYHYYRFIPQGAPISIRQSTISYEAFLYMVANPYYKFTNFTLTMEPLMSKIEGSMLKVLEQTADKISNLKDKRCSGANQLMFFYHMRILGILQRTYINKLNDSSLTTISKTGQ